jgi:transposase InsO family protein
MQRTSKPLERVHSDLLGPIQVEAFPGNEKYIISFIDDYSKFTQVYLMKNKSESLDKLKKFIAEIGIPRELHTDNGGEYTSNAFKEFCIEKSIKQTFTIPYTPQQNSIAERFWKTLMAMIRAMLKQADMEKK